MFDYIIYIIAAGSALILGLLLKQPLLPEEPKRQSWTISAVFPTAVLALGFTAMISKLGYFTSSNLDYITALAIGVITAIFSRFMLEKMLPRPKITEDVPEEPVEPARPEKPVEPAKSEGEELENPEKENLKDLSDEKVQEESHG